MKTTFRVSEIFRSLQGEGPSIGKPATFIRLQGCAVGCSWCDTKYSWPSSEGKAMELHEINAETAGSERGLLIVTGGEPLAHTGILELLAWGTENFGAVEVETSGIMPPVSPGRMNIDFNWSPKLPRVTPRADETWMHAEAFGRACGICKVVVRDVADFAEAAYRIGLHRVPPARVVIMPQGVESFDLDERMRALAPLCIEGGYRLSPRLHIQLWGRERGR